MKEEIKKLIEELKEVISDLELEEIEDMNIMDFAVRIYLSEKIQQYKKENVKEMKEGKNIEPATEPQLYRLKKMKIKIPENLSKQEASRLISENMEQGDY
jgi:ERCC4-related helicase